MKSSNDDDVIAYLKGQHEQIKALFGKTFAAQDEERASAFLELRRLMAVHETVEEVVVHPTARRALLAIGESIVSARLAEERQAKQALIALESLDVKSPDFETQLRALETAVLAHAEKEESEEFSRLGEALDSSHVARMKQAAQLLEHVAPTRPHPGLESRGESILLGPFAAMVDRTRDFLTGKS